MSPEVRIIKTYPPLFDEESRPATVGAAMLVIDILTRVNFADQEKRGVKLSNSKDPVQFVKRKVTLEHQTNDMIELVVTVRGLRRKVFEVLFELMQADQRNNSVSRQVPQEIKSQRIEEFVRMLVGKDDHYMEDVPLKDVAEAFWREIRMSDPDLLNEITTDTPIGASELFALILRYVIPMDKKDIPEADIETSFNIQSAADTLGGTLVSDTVNEAFQLAYVPTTQTGFGDSVVSHLPSGGEGDDIAGEQVRIVLSPEDREGIGEIGDAEFLPEATELPEASVAAALIGARVASVATEDVGETRKVPVVPAGEGSE